LKTKKQYYDEIKVLQLERLKLKERDILSNEAKTKFVKQILDRNNQLRKENDEKDKKIKTFESGSFQEEPPEYDSDLVERLLTVLENSQLQLKDNLYSKKKV
jgi:FtsZ-binding cell division protein ZapB